MLKAISSNGQYQSEQYHHGNGHPVSVEAVTSPQQEQGFKQYFDPNFEATPEYISTLPDMQNTENQAIPVPIQHVGIHNFKIPMQIINKAGQSIPIHASITGTVSLEAHKKGINMSRIMRTFYEYEDRALTPETLKEVVTAYLERLESSTARIAIAFDYPLRQQSLRSGLSGYQYYPTVLETRLTPAGIRHFIHVDFIYSSTCPCSYELSVHANQTRGVAAVPHSQRSIAQVSIEHQADLHLEEVITACQTALQTETQVMVKREDEQAFAELNAANLKFVEDAVRLLYQLFNKEERIRDFRVFASHQESLHSHDAISVIVKGVPDGFTADVEPFRYR